MISDNDRRFYVGASDSKWVITPNHNTKTWQEKWLVKLGVAEQEDSGNIYTQAGTRWEHPILEKYAQEIGIEINKDKQIILEDKMLRVNYDGDDGLNIYEVKTHKAANTFEVTPYIDAQCQTQMYVWQETQEDFGKLYVLSYALEDKDYANMNPTADDVDFNRIKVHKVKYSKRKAKHFLECLDPLLPSLKEAKEKADAKE